MKNRRNVVVAFLVVAVMLLGIGYAALTDVLDITGSVDVNQSAAEEAFNEDIYFSAAVANDDGNTASVNTDNNDTINTFKGKDDVATFTFTIKNNGDVDANVTPRLNASLGNTNPEYFTIESDWDGDSKVLAAGQEITYTLTITMIKTPTETIAGSFLVELVATSVDPAPAEPGEGE